jgi:2-polyprenyl-3-methyl-5-hydroxy-6-metoxy-1,4-benzoquinol methylase
MTMNLPCKICKCTQLEIVAHTAKCTNCRVLLYYPYPINDNDAILDSIKKWDREGALRWYEGSSFLNHNNFTNMLRFMMDGSSLGESVDVLDYGGGGGQFALVCKSHFPLARVFITDIADHALLDEWRPFSIQIPFEKFPEHGQLYDYIFLNDVYEHVSDPVAVLKLLATKLKPGGGIFVDTPKQFWIYGVSALLWQGLYRKILRGTVSTMHLQIWSKKSFFLAAESACLLPVRYQEVSEYTMPARFYLDNMDIKNPLIRLIGSVFYRLSKYIAKNKILSILKPVSSVKL